MSYVVDDMWTNRWWAFGAGWHICLLHDGFSSFFVFLLSCINSLLLYILLWNEHLNQCTRVCDRGHTITKLNCVQCACWRSRAKVSSFIGKRLMWHSLNAHHFNEPNAWTKKKKSHSFLLFILIAMSVHCTLCSDCCTWWIDERVHGRVRERDRENEKETGQVLLFRIINSAFHFCSCISASQPMEFLECLAVQKKCSYITFV